MVNIIDKIAVKVDEIIHPHGTTATNQSTVAGTHSGLNNANNLNTTYNAGNTPGGALDPTSAATGPASHTAGPSPHNIVNILDPTVDSDLSGGNHMGLVNPAKVTTAGTYGTHPGAYDGSGVPPTAGSGVGTYSDPTLRHTSGAGALASSNQPYSTSSTTGPTSYGVNTNSSAAPFDPTSPATGPASHTAGPSSSNIINRMNPLNDSGLDETYGTTTNTANTGNYGAYGAANTAGTLDPTSSATGPATRTAGPSSSNLVNKLNPAIDSDLSSANPTSSATGPASRTAGPSSSNLVNKLNPAVDSDLSSTTTGDRGYGTGVGSNTSYNNTGYDGSAGTYGSNTTGLVGTSTNLDQSSRASGPAPHTAGPHTTDVANQLDPRVDSDLDGRAGVHDFGNDNPHHAGHHHHHGHHHGHTHVQKEGNDRVI